MKSIQRFLKALTAMFVALCFCFTPTLVEASCPSTVPDNTSTGWVQGQCWDQMFSDGCYYNICFCYRRIPGTRYFDYTVSSIRKVNSTCGSQITNVNVGGLAQEALHHIIILDPAYAVYYKDIPPCSSGYVKLVRRAVKALCWEVDPPSGGDGGYAYPCGTTGWCVVEDSVCMSGGYPQWTGGNTYTFSGTCSCNVITCQ